MKRRTSIYVAISSLIFIAFLVIYVFSKKQIDKSFDIAFLNLPENIENSIKEFFPTNPDIVLKFHTIQNSNLNSKKKNFDLLFTWDGEISNSLIQKSELLTNRVLQNIPISLRNSKKFPILLDNYELSFLKEPITKHNLQIPYTYDDFIDYLYELKKYVFTPFFCEGGNDRTLFALIGSIVQAVGGFDSYSIFQEQLKKQNSLEQIFDIQLAENFCLRNILDDFKDMVQNGLIHPLWYIAKKNDVLTFAESNQIGVIYMSLSEHRTFPYKIITKYESTSFPSNVSPEFFGLISPSVICMQFGENMNNYDFLNYISQTEFQDNLTMKTFLAPTNYHAECFDRQADDVRFWAASCKYGSIPDISLACFQTNPDKMNKFANEIRDYLSKKN